MWLSRDPAGFVDGPNLYAYVMQNPWTGFDPDGLFVSAILEKLDEHVFTPVGEAIGQGIASVMPAETLVNVTQNSQAFAATGQALNGAKSASMKALNTLSPFDDAAKAALNGDLKGALVEGGKEVAGGKFAKAGGKLLKAGGEMMAGLAKKSDNMVASAQKNADEAAALVDDAAKSRTKWGPEHGKGNVEHNNAIEDALDTAEARGATDLRKNRVQRDAAGDRVRASDGSTRPDAAWIENGVRHNHNRVSNSKDLDRELDAFRKMNEADPKAINSLEF